MSVNSLRDGFVKLCLDTSLNTAPEKCRLVIEGQYFDPALGCTVQPDVLVKVNPRDIDCQFGAGSILAEALKVAAGCCGGSEVDIYALPRLDPVGAVAAVHRMTMGGGVPDTDGVIDIYIGDGRYNFSVNVTAGTALSVVADNIAAAVPADFPFTATANVVSGRVDFTAKNAGVVGNDFEPVFNWTGAANRVPGGMTFAVGNVTAGSGLLTPLDYETVLGSCCVCCIAVLEDSAAMRANLKAYLDAAWACDTPQCFGHGYVYISSSLGNALAADTNAATLSIMAASLTDPVFPWLKLAAYAAQSCCSTANNPEISVQGPNFGVLSCLTMPESCGTTWTYEESLQLQDAGLVVTVPLSGGQGQLTSPMVVNDVTNSRYDAEGRLNYTFRDAASRRLAAATAIAIATKLQEFNGLGYYTENTAIRAGTRGTTARMMLGQLRAWAKSQVGVLFSQFDDLDKDLTLVDDFSVSARCAGVPGKLHMNIVYRPPVRITNVQVNAQPKLLSNC